VWNLSQENLNNRLYYLIIAMTIVIVLMAAALYAGSQASSDNTERTIHMNGHAEIKVVPDTATLDIGVVVESATANEAVAENADIMSAVIEELKGIGLEERNIRTSHVSVYPVYNYEKERTIEGYSASNNVQVTTTMLDRLGDIIDRSAAAGANQIGSIAFSVSTDMQKEMREDLVDEAVEDAASKAGMLAENLGVRISGVQTSSLSDSGGYRVQYEMPQAAMDEAVPTPIQPGESTVSMSVQVTYLIE
jgi:uncharacterized protein YggE